MYWYLRMVLAKLNRKKNIYIAIIVVLLMAFYRFHGSSIVLASHNCGTPAVWKHGTGTIEKLKIAEQQGFCGIEVDVIWISKGYFIAEYADPNKESAPKLSELITAFPNFKYWWLDVKNLDVANAAQASKGLNILLKQTSGKMIIESHNIFGLSLFTSNERIYKAYWLAKNESWAGFIPYQLRSIFAMLVINPEFVSMFDYQVGENDYIWLGARTRLAFTVNNIQVLNSLFLNDVAVVLTDTLTPKDVSLPK